MTKEEEAREQLTCEFSKLRRRLSETTQSNVAAGSGSGDAQRCIAAADLPGSDADFRYLFDNSPDAFLLMTSDGTVAAANPAACTMFGMTEAEFITKRKLIQETNSTLAAIVQSTDDAIIGKSLDGQILTWNRGAEKIYGYTAGEVIGHNISILVPKDRHDEVPAILQKIRENESIDHYEAVRHTKEGRQIHISLTVSPIQDASGRIIGASSIARDITERKCMEEALRRAYEELEMKVQQRTMELAEKSTHLEEINTALRVLLKQREDDRKEFGESILMNVRNLISPYIERLKGSNLGRTHATLVEIVDSHLNEITSSFSRTLSMRNASLTPTEMRVASFIRDGKTTAAIAEILCISDKTVACHRANVRKKLGLQGERNNLRSFLLSIS